MKRRIPDVGLVALLLCVFAGATMSAEDWPRHRGKGDLGIWTETGIVETLPPNGLPVRWRVPINGGYSAPAVVAGRVFVSDFIPGKGAAPAEGPGGGGTSANPRIGVERALALDEKTGKTLWTAAWPANYTGIGQARGPKATPTVNGDRVYVLGSAGDMVALDVKTGEILWRYNFVKDFHVPMEHWSGNWGWAAAPLIDGNKVICLVGGDPYAMVVAFDKITGKELWRALSARKGEVAPSFSSPIIVNAGGTRQLIAWDTSQISSLNPDTGQVYWEYPWSQTQIGNIATPVQDGKLLFFSSFYNGAVMLQLDDSKPGFSVLWKGNSDSEVVTDAVHNGISTSHIVGDYIYGIDSYGQLRCLKKMTGERVWETQEVTNVRGQFVSAQLIRNGDRFFINNDNGDLIIAKLAPTGYTEISRLKKVIEPTTPNGRRMVNWGYPAYANKHMIIRNDKEIISYNMAAGGAAGQ